MAFWEENANSMVQRRSCGGLRGINSTSVEGLNYENRVTERGSRNELS